MLKLRSDFLVKESWGTNTCPELNTEDVEFATCKTEPILLFNKGAHHYFEVDKVKGGLNTLLSH